MSQSWQPDASGLRDDEIPVPDVSGFELHAGALIQAEGPLRMPLIDLGLTLWEGSFERETALWLRWCRAGGELVPSGAEWAEQEKQRAEQEIPVGSSRRSGTSRRNSAGIALPRSSERSESSPTTDPHGGYRP